MSPDKNFPIETKSDQLIEKFIRNDEKMLAETCANNFKLVRGYVMKNNGKEANAKDVFQEAILVVRALS